MKRSLDRLQRLADGLLDLIRVDTGAVVPAPVVLELGAFVGRYVSEFSSVAEQRGVALGREVAGEVKVRADPTMLETVVLNLLSNALKFTARGGTVRVSARLRDDKAVMAISDTGIGIAPERIPRLFDRFSASSREARADYFGFGIGLPLADGLARLMGGKLEVDSALGKGSEFRLLLPACDGAPVAVGGASSERIRAFFPRDGVAPVRPAPGAGRGGLRVLIVDDDPDMTAFLSATLDERFDATYVGSGSEALRLLESGPAPEVVVCDVMMPDVDGLELKRRADQLGSLAGVPFVFLTARSDAATKSEGYASGAVDYVTKPLALSDLEAKLDSLVHVSRAALESLEKRVLRVLHEQSRSDAGGDWRERAVGLGLSEGDMAILEAVMEGLSDKEIGARLRRSTRTVSNRVSAILKRTGVPSRAGLMAMLHRPR